MWLVVMAVVCVASAPAGADIVGGVISSDTHWTVAQSPYLVVDSITIVDGATLTIDPGVVVKSDPHVALVVGAGTLVARGTEASPILFTQHQVTSFWPDRWAYIQFSNGATDASFDSGGNYVAGCILEHTKIQFAGSTAAEGAVRAIHSRPYIAASTFQDNSRGGIYVSGSGASSIRLEDNRISGNTGAEGILVQSAPSAELRGNELQGDSVRLTASPGSILTNNTISANIAPNYGGGIYLDDSGWCTLADNTISGNVGRDSGGGIYLYGSPSCTLTHNTVTGNTAGAGGGLFLASSGSCTLTDNTITGNIAGFHGGGVHLRASGLCTLTNNTISGNTAQFYYGGGLYLETSGGCTFTDNTITDNRSGRWGGAIYADGAGGASFSGDRIVDNHTDYPFAIGGVFATNGSDGWDLTGPDIPNNPDLCVHLYGNDGYEFYNNNDFGGSFDPSGPGNVDARYVYWGTTNEAVIEAGICDFFDDASKGVVLYQPFAHPGPPRIEALEVFYHGKFADAADPAKTFLAVGEASSMSLVGDDLHGNVTNYLNGITGVRVTFDTVVTFSVDAAAAFSYEATPEQSGDKTFTAFTPPTAPTYAVDNGAGKTVITITFADGEIKNRWLKTIVDASQVSANGSDLDGELTAPLTLPSGDGAAGGNAEFIIGNRIGDVDGDYRCLLNDAVLVRANVSGAVVVGISNACDVDKNERVLLNDAILTRSAVTGTALPALP